MQKYNAWALSLPNLTTHTVRWNNQWRWSMWTGALRWSAANISRDHIADHHWLAANDHSVILRKGRLHSHSECTRTYILIRWQSVYRKCRRSLCGKDVDWSIRRSRDHAACQSEHLLWNARANHHAACENALPKRCTFYNSRSSIYFSYCCSATWSLCLTRVRNVLNLVRILLEWPKFEISSTVVSTFCSSEMETMIMHGIHHRFVKAPGAPSKKH